MDTLKEKNVAIQALQMAKREQQPNHVVVGLALDAAILELSLIKFGSDGEPIANPVANAVSAASCLRDFVKAMGMETLWNDTFLTK